MDSGTPSDRELQFDQVVSASAPPAPQPAVGTVTCQACVTPIETEYYDVNGSPFCARCRSEAEAAAVVPRGVGPLARAGLFGFGAGVAGAAIYYGVIALTNLEIGFVAILIGYMVGYAVRKGARGRGGLRFQLLGVALTYASVAMAYTPIAVSAAMSQPSAASAGGVVAGVSTPAAAPVAEPVEVTGSEIVFGLAGIVAFIFALPMLVVFGSMPSGLISALIIFIGMRQAWVMTGVPTLQVLGPYQVGTETASAPLLT